MKNALIDPSVLIQHVVSWTDTTPKQPVYETYANSARVAEVIPTTFAVSPPLFWVVCQDTIVADQWYYDTANSTFNPVVNAPMPSTI